MFITFSMTPREGFRAFNLENRKDFNSNSPFVQEYVRRY